MIKAVVLGWHWTISAHGAQPPPLDDHQRLVSALTTIPPRLALRTVSEPRVITHADDSAAGLIILAESHFGLHAFPERQIVHGDLFSCKAVDFGAARRGLEQHFDVAAVRHEVIPRAVPAVRPPLNEVVTGVRRTLTALRHRSATWATLALEIDASGAAELPGLDAVNHLAARLLDHAGMLLPERLVHCFTPVGVTLVRHGTQGRLVIHTWPEHQLATVDLSCPIPSMERAAARWLDGRGLGVLGARLAPMDDPVPTS